MVCVRYVIVNTLHKGENKMMMMMIMIMMMIIIITIILARVT
jgi:hypothetical protein